MTSVTRLNSSGSTLSAGPKTVTMALLIQTSIRLQVATTWSAACRTAAALATSTGMAIACPPSALTSAATASKRFRPRARIATRHPRRANSSATARPTPADPPVITTVFRSAEISIISLLYAAEGYNAQ
ncbi:protein of unknown function [Pseudorhizobium banfieldiae]|uniref:Uncharacterized protein n=1 Tax=Pseudorhizobium banfieldiae TaxID=1125847 RepID=L0NEE1_9HYPH|nr:protein of unknown function [Pseudorhizobium banfieldiae]